MDNDVICRQAEEKDQVQVQLLWRQCFDDAAQFVEWYFSRYYRAEHTLGIFDMQSLQASAQMIPYTIQVRDTAISCAYIVGVDTAVEARNKGYAKKLLLECLKKQRERNQVISLLMPFEGQFYYRYSWPFCYFHQQIIIKPQELRCAAKHWGNIYPMDLFEAKPELQRIYMQFCEQYHGTVYRDQETWQLLLEDAALEKTVCFLLEADNEVQGYCLWTPLQGKSFIRELAWVNERAKNGLLWFLMHNVPEGNLLWLELAEDDSLVFQLAATKTAVVQYPFLMARIVDVIQCLEAISYPTLQTAFLLEVTDDFADWNAGCYAVQIAQKKAMVRKLSKHETMSAVPDAAITIAGLSQLVMGARSAQQLQAQEILHVQRQDMLELFHILWTPQHNYINTYY